MKKITCFKTFETEKNVALATKLEGGGGLAEYIENIQDNHPVY